MLTETTSVDTDDGVEGRLNARYELHPLPPMYLRGDHRRIEEFQRTAGSGDPLAADAVRRGTCVWGTRRLPMGLRQQNIAYCRLRSIGAEAARLGSTLGIRVADVNRADRGTIPGVAKVLPSPALSPRAQPAPTSDPGNVLSDLLLISTFSEPSF